MHPRAAMASRRPIAANCYSPAVAPRQRISCDASEDTSFLSLNEAGSPNPWTSAAKVLTNKLNMTELCRPWRPLTTMVLGVTISIAPFTWFDDSAADCARGKRRHTKVCTRVTGVTSDDDATNGKYYWREVLEFVVSLDLQPRLSSSRRTDTTHEHDKECRLAGVTRRRDRLVASWVPTALGAPETQRHNHKICTALLVRVPKLNAHIIDHGSPVAKSCFGIRSGRSIDRPSR